MNGCVFAGTFDPITIGHEEIIRLCIKKYGKVMVVVGQNPQKTQMLSESDRLELVKATFSGEPQVQVVLYSLVKDKYAEFLKNSGFTVYIRGIRNQRDLELEDKMKSINAKLYPFISTEYIYAKNNVEVSSSMVRDAIANGQNFLKYIPQKAQKLAQKIMLNK